MEPDPMSEAVETKLLDLMEKANEKLNKIETGLTVQAEILKTHTQSDTQNFDTLNEKLGKVQEDLDLIKLARAEEHGAAKALENSNRNSALKWGGGIAAILTGAVEVVRQFWPSGQ